MDQMQALAEIFDGLPGGQGVELDAWQKLDVPAAFARRKEQMQQMSAERREKAEIIARPFQTPAGRACLRELLNHVVLQRLTLPIKGTTLEEQALHAARRQGENSMVAFLFQQIAIAEGQKPETTDGGA